MSKKSQVIFACGLVVIAPQLFAGTNYAQLQQQAIANDSVLKSLQQSLSKLMM